MADKKNKIGKSKFFYLWGDFADINGAEYLNFDWFETPEEAIADALDKMVIDADFDVVRLEFSYINTYKIAIEAKEVEGY